MNLDTMTFTPNQRESVECLSQPLLLCAGAGSGKTFTLQNRIAYALCPESGSGVESIDQILAITFTKKAAAEIKGRVRSALRSEGMMEEALRADAAWISTIHGMCSRILKEHALELGIDPDFEMLDDVQGEELRRRAFSNVLARIRRDGDTSFDDLFAEYGVGDYEGSVSVMVNRILDQAAMLTDGMDAIDLGPVDEARASSVARELIIAFQDILDTGVSGSTGLKAQEAYDALGAFVLDPVASTSEGWPVLFGILEGLPKPDLPRKTKNSGPEVEAAREAVAASRIAVDKAYIEVNHGAAIAFAKDLLRLARDAREEYERLKLQANAVDQDGLLRLTLKVLSEYPHIAQQYRERFKLVMVDEFQDTNQLQIDLIRCICGDDLKTLCTVGDSQQSIYRFRGADVNVYLDHKKEMHTERVGAKCLQLDDNFRSHGDVLAFVRAVCGQDGYFAEEFLDLKAGRKEKTGSEAKYQGDGPRINMQVTEYLSRGGTAKSEGAVAVEAERIADWFSNLKSQGHAPSDMVILMGSTTHAAAYARALRKRGLDCMLTGGSDFYKAPEVRLVDCLLKVLVNPADTESLFAVLSGEMMALSADDLVWLATHFPDEADPDALMGHEPLYKKLLRDLPEDVSARLTFARQLLDRAWGSLGALAPSCVVANVFEDSGWLNRLAAKGPEGDAVAANLIKAVRIIRSIEADPGMDIARVSRKFTQMMRNKDKMGALVGEESNAVRLMTVHSSKGLEFPFVAVTHCYSVNEAQETLELVVFGNQIHMALSLKEKLETSSKDGESFAKMLAEDIEESPVDPAEWAMSAKCLAEYKAALLAYRKKEALLEKRRLFYVAATRASEALLIACLQPMSSKGPSENGIALDIYSGLFPKSEEWYPQEDCLVGYGGSQPMRFTLLNADELYRGEEEADEEVSVMTYPVLRDRPLVKTVATKPRVEDVFSYSGIATYDPRALGVVGGGYAQDEDKATSFGSALHSLAELAALMGADKAVADVDRMARTYGIADADRLRAAFNAWLSSDTHKRAWSYERVIPELSFCVPMGEDGPEADVFLEGEMDLHCANANGEVLVVDYKTGRNEAETPEILQRKHQLQAQCYAYAALLQGADCVRLEFVHVEREDANTPGQPLVTVYEFGRGDLDGLRSDILAAYGKASV